MLQLKRISQEQVITIDKYGYTKYINKKKPTKVDTIEFKNLGEIRFHTYGDVLRYLSTELVNIAKEVILDSYIMSDDDTYDYTLTNGNVVKMSTYTLGYRVRVTKTFEEVVTTTIEE